eukprot:6183380-Lingulodinium_polyedra.AAC.1
MGDHTDCENDRKLLPRFALAGPRLGRPEINRQTQTDILPRGGIPTNALVVFENGWWTGRPLHKEA